MKKDIMIVILILSFASIGFLFENKSYAKMNIDDELKISLKNIKTSNVFGSAFVPVEPEVEESTLKAFDVLVKESGDFASFTFDIVNDGDFDVKINNINKIKPSCTSLALPENIEDEKKVCNHLDYLLIDTITNKEIKEFNVIKSHSRKNITLKVSYNNQEKLQDEVQITLFDMNFIFDK